MKLKYTGNIYLIGFMGSGKSTIGPLLAKRSKRIFFDTDEWIKNEFGKSILQIFTEDGEDSFRQKEIAGINLVSRMSNLIVAVGGGAVINPENWIRIKNTGISVYLKCSPEEIYRRVKNNKTRPLLIENDKDKYETIKSLMKSREQYYEMADFTVESCKDESREVFANRLIKTLRGYI